MSMRIWARADRFVLAGGSYGGFVALEYALVHSDKLIALILRDTSPQGPACAEGALATILSSPRIHPDRDRQIRVWTGKVLNNRDLEQGYLEILPIYSRKSLPKMKRDPALILHYETHNAAFSRNVPKYDVTEKLGAINIPTLVVVGRYDIICPVAFSQIIAESIPGAQLAIFENSGHGPPGEEPDAFQKCVRGFLRSLGL